MRLARHVAGMGKRRGEYRVWLEKPEGNTPLGKPRHRWGGSIEIALQEVNWDMGWTGLSQDRNKCRALVSMVINFLIS
jgi:hypothetical protein